MKKEITKYLNNGDYCILVPVFYECEEKPAWRQLFVGTKEECKARFDDYPDSLNATSEENKEMREMRFNEYKFLQKINKNNKDMENIRRMYGFT